MRTRIYYTNSIEILFWIVGRKVILYTTLLIYLTGIIHRYKKSFILQVESGQPNESDQKIFISL